jgi:phosphoadenosine phosphosulfate reductase
MFEEECKFLEQATGRRMPGGGWQDGLWMRHKTIWFHGKTLMHLSSNGKVMVMKEYLADHWETTPTHSVTPQALYKANESALQKLEEEAIAFVRETVKTHPERKPVVSFSGGKDSAVVSYLVRKALSDDILHIFGNTTMEYPDTVTYVERFKNTTRIRFLENSSSCSFLEMCGLIGPPSRINAWCCSVFKAAPIAAMLGKINGHKGIISFEGIRRNESVRRRNRERLYLNKKIVHQLSAYPILDWKEVEVWLFILTREIAFNDAYQKGFARVGCMYCPNNTAYDEYLIKRYYYPETKGWLAFLTKYARDIGKEDPSDYVSSGAWKMRVGKSQGRSSVYVRKVPCLKNMNAMHFILDKQVDDSFVERFRPMGKIERFNSPIGDGFILKDPATDDGLFMVKVVKDMDVLRRESRIEPGSELGDEFLCVDLLTTKGGYRLLQTIERQLRKFQVCVLCGACAGVCPTGAIKINPHFRVVEDKCSRCGRCLSTKYVKAGCVSLNSQQQGSRFPDVNRFQ